MYEYQAIVKRVIDGDTIVVDIDLGFDVWLRDAYVRLSGIDTPELRSSNPTIKQAAYDAKAFVEKRCVVGSKIFLLSKSYYGERDKYGRVLAVITYVDLDGTKKNLNEQLLESGLAIAYGA